MTRRIASTLALLTLSAELAACHTMRFEIAHIPSSAIAPPITEWKHYWLGGLVPTLEVDVAARCPNGAAAVTEETTFLDGLISTVTLAIYTPRTSYYECRLEPYVPPAPPVTTP